MKLIDTIKSQWKLCPSLWMFVKWSYGEFLIILLGCKGYEAYLEHRGWKKVFHHRDGSLIYQRWEKGDEYIKWTKRRMRS